MICNCCPKNIPQSCEKCYCDNPYCDICPPIYSPVTDFYSCKFANLEHNYPVKKCLCHNYGTNPRYYAAAHIPCDCSKKCYPC